MRIAFAPADRAARRRKSATGRNNVDGQRLRVVIDCTVRARPRACASPSDAPPPPAKRSTTRPLEGWECMDVGGGIRRPSGRKGGGHVRAGGGKTCCHLAPNWHQIKKTGSP